MLRASMQTRQQQKNRHVSGKLNMKRSWKLKHMVGLPFGKCNKRCLNWSKNNTQTPEQWGEKNTFWRVGFLLFSYIQTGIQLDVTFETKIRSNAFIVCPSCQSEYHRTIMWSSQAHSRNRKFHLLHPSRHFSSWRMMQYSTPNTSRVF